MVIDSICTVYTIELALASASHIVVVVYIVVAVFKAMYDLHSL